MSTSPIAAAAFTPTSLTSPGGANREDSGDKAEFRQVLQMTTGVSSGAPTAAVVPPSLLPAHDDPTGPLNFSLPVDSPSIKETLSAANVVAASSEVHTQPDATNTSGSNHKKEKNDDKTVPIHAKGASGEIGLKEHLRERSDTPNPFVVALVAVTTLTEPHLRPRLLISAAPFATVQELFSTQQSKVAFNLPADFKSVPTHMSAAVAPSTVDPVIDISSPATEVPSSIAMPDGLSSSSVPSSPTMVSGAPEPTSRAILSTVATSGVPARLKAQQQASIPSPTATEVPNSIATPDGGSSSAPSSPTIVSGVLEPTSRAIFSTVATSGAPARLKAQQQASIPYRKPDRAGSEASPALNTNESVSAIVPPLTREQFPNNSQAASHSALAEPSSNSEHRSHRSRSESASPLSGGQEKNAPPNVTRDSFSSATFASSVASHSSSFQLNPVQSAASHVTDAATPDAALSASAVFATSQSSPLVSAHAQPNIKSNPIPDPPRMVDSGQLRVTDNHSELKISVQLPDLGKVEIRAVTSHDVTTAHLTASSHEALQVFAADRTGLEQALKTQDVILGVLNSDTQGQSAGQQRQQEAQQHAQFSNCTSPIATSAGASATIEASTPEFLPDYSSISVRA